MHFIIKECKISTLPLRFCDYSDYSCLIQAGLLLLLTVIGSCLVMRILQITLSGAFKNQPIKKQVNPMTQVEYERFSPGGIPRSEHAPDRCARYIADLRVAEKL